MCHREMFFERKGLHYRGSWGSLNLCLPARVCVRESVFECVHRGLRVNWGVYFSRVCARMSSTHFCLVCVNPLASQSACV